MLRHLARWWVVVVMLSAVVAAEWLRRPSWAAVALLAGLAAAAVAAIRPLGTWRRRTLATLLAALPLVLAVAQWRLDGIEHRWPAVRESRIERASARLERDLGTALERADRLADRAARLADGPAAPLFGALAQELPREGPETAVVVMDPDGTPWAWAGRHRLTPRAAGDSLAVRSSPFYVVLEIRRHSASGRVAVASALLWAHPAVPERTRSLAEQFRARAEVGLQVYPAGAAPDAPDVFDWEVPTAAGARVLFSVQPLPPEQGTAKELTLGRARRAGTWLAIGVLFLTLLAAPRPPERFAVLLAALWVTLRAPAGDALGLASLFSPATYFRPLLGVFSTSAGALAATGILVTVLGVWLRRRRLLGRWAGVAAGVPLLLVAPYLIRALGRGITPPAAGVPVGLWLTWQLTLVVTATAVLLLAAAALCATLPAEGGRARVAVGIGIALIATVAGLVLWRPDGAWPDWYAFVWAPAFALVTLPAPRWWAIVGIAVVAGTSAALVTWGAELQGRMDVAGRDVAGLGDELDPLAIPSLERFGEAARAGTPPDSAAELYALWHGSELRLQNYPVQLALWSPDGALLGELPLDSLDVPASLLSSLVRGMPAADSVAITPLLRVPGMHYVLLARLPGRVLSATVGPRSELVAPSRLGRLVDPGRRGSSLYDLVLSPPEPPGAAVLRRLDWRRDGWQLHAERALAFPSGVRRVQATIDLRGPLPVVVRGTLVVLLDTAMLALLWFLAEFAAGSRMRRPRWRRLARSFRFRLAVTLAGFFVLPAVGFAAWSFARLADEVERSRDLLLLQKLRDAVPAAGGLVRFAPPEQGHALEDLARRIEANLALYRGGRLAATSAPILGELGIVRRLLEPPAYRDLALGGALELTLAAARAPGAERVGYHVVQAGPAAATAVLALPQRAEDAGLAADQLDLALVLLLATLIGAAAAVIGARAAARTLSRPVAELRASAIAVGAGRPLPVPAHQPPLEFEPVFGAFERMAADVRTSQAALEAARRRTAAVLATVATGVVGLDPRGAILIANRQAVDLLGVALPEGARFAGRLGDAWRPLTEAVERFVGKPDAADATAEFSALGRRFTLQLASLGPEMEGTVLALNDVTDLSRAERVLAWGEMARQVAHEIKNPLTPMRLGMQHLRRVWRDRRPEFEATLEETTARVLSEIDRLDTIARAFSRFGAPTEEALPLDRIDLAATAREVVELYRLAGEGTAVALTGAPSAWGAARRDEVKEVLVNLLENARNAGARQIVVDVAPGCFAVTDDGSGIPPELLPRIFEPRFSTTTSGSGLGLSIVRRLVESWGGRVDVESELGRGTRVTVRLAA